MSLEEYVSYKYDFFQLDIEKIGNEAFPCVLCFHNEKQREEYPCNFCAYNENAEECYYCSLCGELTIGPILDSIVAAEGTQAQIGGMCEKCFNILKNYFKAL